jgi:hypothetical protein
MLYMEWVRGALTIPPQYTLGEARSDIPQPEIERNLPWDVNEVPDSILADDIRGMKITWVRMAHMPGGIDSCVVGDHIQISYTFDPNMPEPSPAERILHIRDPLTHTFRAIKAGALVSIKPPTPKEQADILNARNDALVAAAGV